MNLSKLKTDLTIWRKPKNMTVADVAKEMGYSGQTVLSIINNQQEGGKNFWIMLEHVTGLKKGDYSDD